MNPASGSTNCAVSRTRPHSYGTTGHFTDRNSLWWLHPCGRFLPGPTNFMQCLWNLDGGKPRQHSSCVLNAWRISTTWPLLPITEGQPKSLELWPGPSSAAQECREKFWDDPGQWAYGGSSENTALQQLWGCARRGQTIKSLKLRHFPLLNH
jgi:hypothetical protein